MTTERLLRALLGWAQFTRFTGRAEGGVMEAALARFGEDAPRERAQVLRCLGDIALARSQHDEARARYEEARPLYQRVGSVLGEANCIQSLGDIALARQPARRGR